LKRGQKQEKEGKITAERDLGYGSRMARSHLGSNTEGFDKPLPFTTILTKYMTNYWEGHI